MVVMRERRGEEAGGTNDRDRNDKKSKALKYFYTINDSYQTIERVIWRVPTMRSRIGSLRSI